MPLALPPEVPAHVRYENHVSNHVEVVGGTNWDFSRSAVATPIALVVDPVPVVVPPPPRQFQANEALPDQQPVVVVKFGKSGSLVPANMQKLLKALPADSTYVVAGYADSKEKAPNETSEKRAQAVTRYLKKTGKPVSLTMSFGATFPATAESSAANRRVEVFVAPAENP